MKHPYPIDLGGVALDRYLTNLLCALTMKAGGKLQISVSDILKVEDQVLLRYPSQNLQTIVLQLAPRNTDMLITSEAPSWHAESRVPRQNQPAQRIQPPPVNQPEPRRANTLDNLSLYLKEQEREERLREIQEQDEVEQRRAAGLSPFRNIPGK
jgi:hypothetical protein